VSSISVGKGNAPRITRKTERESIANKTTDQRESLLWTAAGACGWCRRVALLA